MSENNINQNQPRYNCERQYTYNIHTHGSNYGLVIGDETSFENRHNVVNEDVQDSQRRLNDMVQRVDKNEEAAAKADVLANRLEKDGQATQNQVQELRERFEKLEKKTIKIPECPSSSTDKRLKELEETVKSLSNQIQRTASQTSSINNKERVSPDQISAPGTTNRTRTPIEHSESMSLTHDASASLTTAEVTDYDSDTTNCKVYQVDRYSSSVAASASRLLGGTWEPMSVSSFNSNFSNTPVKVTDSSKIPQHQNTGTASKSTHLKVTGTEIGNIHQNAKEEKSQKTVSENDYRLKEPLDENTHLKVSDPLYENIYLKVRASDDSDDTEIILRLFTSKMIFFISVRRSINIHELKKIIDNETSKHVRVCYIYSKRLHTWVYSCRRDTSSNSLQHYSIQDGDTVLC